MRKKDKAVPIHTGDVLILQTTQSFTVYAIGQTSSDAQQDFSSGHNNVEYKNNYEAAVARARAIVRPGHRIFLLNIDTADWSEISP